MNDKYKYRLILAPNEAIPFDDPRLPTSFGEPMLVSYKMDGMRCVAIDGVLYSRNAKPLRPEIQDHFAEFLKFAKDLGTVFDGELYEHGNENFGSLMSKISKGGTIVPKDLKFNVFDSVSSQNWAEKSCVDWEFSARYQYYTGILTNVHKFDTVIPVLHSIVKSPQELEKAFRLSMKRNYEGIMARSFKGLYKHGRCTLNDGNIYKFKEWSTADAIVVSFVQASRMTDEVRYGQRETNELGYLERSHKAVTRELVEEIGSITLRLVSGDYAGVEIGSTMAKGIDIGLTWENRQLFVGKHVEVKIMEYGSKDRPRFAKIVRLRPDLDSAT